MAEKIQYRFIHLCEENLLQLRFLALFFISRFTKNETFPFRNESERQRVTTGTIDTSSSDSRLFVSLGILWKRGDDDRGRGGSQVYPRLCISARGERNPKWRRVANNEIHAADQFCTRPRGFSMTSAVPVELRPDARRRGTERRTDWGGREDGASAARKRIRYIIQQAYAEPARRPDGRGAFSYFCKACSDASISGNLSCWYADENTRDGSVAKPAASCATGKYCATYTVTLSLRFREEVEFDHFFLQCTWIQLVLRAKTWNKMLSFWRKWILKSIFLVWFLKKTSCSCIQGE